MKTDKIKIISPVECLSPSLEEYWDLLKNSFDIVKGSAPGLIYQVSDNRHLIVNRVSIREPIPFTYKGREFYYCKVPYEESIISQLNITTVEEDWRGYSIVFGINYYPHSNLFWVKSNYSFRKFGRDDGEGRFNVIIDKDLKVISSNYRKSPPNLLPFNDERGAYKWKRKFRHYKGKKVLDSEDLKRLNEIFYDFDRNTLSVFDQGEFDFETLNQEEIWNVNNLELPKNMAQKLNLDSISKKLRSYLGDSTTNFLDVYCKDLSSSRLKVDKLYMKPVKDISTDDLRILEDMAKQLLKNNREIEFINIGVYIFDIRESTEMEYLFKSINRINPK